MSNPLIDYYRKPEVTVILPAGEWYHDDTVEFTDLKEVPVYSMLPAEEIMLLNPDALVSGVAMIEAIKSCVPAVKNPNNLYYPDVNALLLAIQRATYGQKISQRSYCPNCVEKRNKLLIEQVEILLKKKGKTSEELTKEEIDEIREEADKAIAPDISKMQENNEILLEPIETVYTYDELIGLSTILPNEKFVEIKDLKVYCSPFKMSDKIKFANLEIKKNQILKRYKMSRSPDEFIDNGFVEQVGQIMDEYKVLSKMSVDIVKECVLKVSTPDGKEITSRDIINEFVEQLDVTSLYKIRDAIRELNSMGVPQTLQYECPCCNHKWEDSFNGYNQTDFFGSGS